MKFFKDEFNYTFRSQENEIMQRLGNKFLFPWRSLVFASIFLIGVSAVLLNSNNSVGQIWPGFDSLDTELVSIYYQ